MLIAEECDFIVEESLRDAREGVVVQRLRQVDAADFGAEVLADAFDREWGRVAVSMVGPFTDKWERLSFPIKAATLPAFRHVIK